MERRGRREQGRAGCSLADVAAVLQDRLLSGSHGPGFGWGRVNCHKDPRGATARTRLCPALQKPAAFAGQLQLLLNTLLGFSSALVLSSQWLHRPFAPFSPPRYLFVILMAFSEPRMTSCSQQETNQPRREVCWQLSLRGCLEQHNCLS